MDEERLAAVITDKRITGNSVLIRYYAPKYAFWYTSISIYILGARDSIDIATQYKKVVHTFVFRKFTQFILLLQVAWLGRPQLESTWEPKSSLPPFLVADYENGVSQQIQEYTTTTAGQTIHTLSTVRKTSCDTEKPPNSKRSRIQYPDITSDSSGYVCFM